MIKLFFRRKTNSDSGWTLIEMLVVFVIVGVMTAVSAPVLSGMNSRNRLRGKMDEIKSAIAQGQQAAIKSSRPCVVTLTASGVTGLFEGTTDSCISSSVSLDSGQTLSWDGGATFKFSFKGTTTTSKTLELKSTGTEEEKCLAISAGIGIMRSGDLVGTTCETSI